MRDISIVTQFKARPQNPKRSGGWSWKLGCFQKSERSGKDETVKTGTSIGRKVGSSFDCFVHSVAGDGTPLFTVWCRLQLTRPGSLKLP
eukprot:scaffold3481_cov315-Pinguiococcus_pyrenoidosus.AAC.1